jgi:hypothetical protein
LRQVRLSLKDLDTFNYDAENRIITAGSITYTYDGDGQRVEKSSGTLYWRGGGTNALIETDLTGNPTAQYISSADAASPAWTSLAGSSTTSLWTISAPRV